MVSTPVKPNLHWPDATLKAEQFFKNNSASKPSQFPYECLRSSLHDSKTTEEVYSEAKGLTNLKKFRTSSRKFVRDFARRSQESITKHPLDSEKPNLHLLSTH